MSERKNDTSDEASRLWKVLEEKQEGRERSMRPVLAVVVVLGLAILLTGLWIVAFG
jgi:hypothetical protein